MDSILNYFVNRLVILNIHVFMKHCTLSCIVLPVCCSAKFSEHIITTDFYNNSLTGKILG